MFLVLWSHSGHLLPEAWRQILTPIWFRPGFWGVTVFFSISGFLVIGQLLDMVTGHRQGLESVCGAALVANSSYLLDSLGVIQRHGCRGVVGWSPLILNGLFLQGPMGLAPVLLPVSWSLVIEEWSYLGFAALAALLLFCRQQFQASKHSLDRTFLVVLLILPALAGALRWWALDQDVSVQALKQALFLQIDALCYGGLLAWCLRRVPRSFHRFAGTGAVTAPLVLGAFCLLSTSVPELFKNVLQPVSEGASRIWLAFGFYPFAGILSAALVAASWQFRYSMFPEYLRRACQVLSRCSYSVYLVHLPLAHLLLQLKCRQACVCFFI